MSVGPALKLLEELGEEKDFDIHEISKEISPPEYSKKQNRLFNNAMKQPKSVILDYLDKFKEGKL